MAEPTDEQIEELKQKRFRGRVERVLATMAAERIDWRGIPVVTPDGRIGVRVVPVEMTAPAQPEPDTSSEG